MSDNLVKPGYLKPGNVKRYQSFIYSLQALLNGAVDANVLDSPVAERFAKMKPVKIVATLMTDESSAFTGMLSVFISMAIGLSAGYFSGIVDEVLTSVTNIFLIIPGLPLMIVIAAYLHFKGLMPIILVIAITGWPSGARILRSQMLSLRNREFVMSAKILGENSIHIIFSEIFPLMFSLIIANFFSATLYAILGEASLEFLGLGNVNLVTWGTILYWAQNNQALLNGAWWWILAPGLCISLLGAGFALLNFSLDEISNPRLRGRD